MNIKLFKEMHKRYLEEFTHEQCTENHDYDEWIEIFDSWVEGNKAGEMDAASEEAN